MKVFELLPRPLGTIFRKLTHFACNSPEHSKLQNWRLHGKGTIAGRAASPLAAASWVAYFGFTVMAMGSAGHALSQAPQPRHFERSTTGHITSPRFSSLMAL